VPCSHCTNKYSFRFSTKNLHKTTQIKTKIKPKNYTYKKKKGFSTVGYQDNTETPSFFASPALGHDPHAPVLSSAPNASPPHTSLKFSLILSISLDLSFFLSRSLFNLSLGWDKKKRRTRKKRKEEEEQGEKKNTKGVCVILKMNRKEKFCRKLLLFVQI
jgi:hypothetical protein